MKNMPKIFLLLCFLHCAFTKCIDRYFNQDFLYEFRCVGPANLTVFYPDNTTLHLPFIKDTESRHFDEYGRSVYFIPALNQTIAKIPLTRHFFQSRIECNGIYSNLCTNIHLNLITETYNELWGNIYYTINSSSSIDCQKTSDYMDWYMKIPPNNDPIDISIANILKPSFIAKGYKLKIGKIYQSLTLFNITQNCTIICETTYPTSKGAFRVIYNIYFPPNLYPQKKFATTTVLPTTKLQTTSIPLPPKAINIIFWILLGIFCCMATGLISYTVYMIVSKCKPKYYKINDSLNNLAEFTDDLPKYSSTDPLKL